MAKDKTSEVRNYILNLIENYEVTGGDKIPGARDIAASTGVSFLKVQQALETLARDGILEIHGRRGTFVQTNWKDRILHENICVFNNREQLPWLDGLKDIMAKKLPGLRFTHAFKKGMLELKTTLDVQKHQNEYMDVSSIFKECYPDSELFFEKVFEPFYIDGKLIGVPFSFSPRVMFIQPEIFERAGCTIPEKEWSWDEFIECIHKLKKVLPVNRILNIIEQSHYWMNFVMRSGGHFFDEKGNVVDSSLTRKGLKLFAGLWNALERFPLDGKEYNEAFYNGKAAMLMGGRQFLSLLLLNGQKNWKVVPLPTIPDGRNVTSQATDLLCIRRSCTNLALAKDYIKMMLSSKVQDFIARQKYAIPIRKSSAFKSIDLTDLNDSVFAVEMGNTTSEPLGKNPNSADLLLTGIDRILAKGIEVDEGMDELMQTVNVFQKVQAHSSRQKSNEDLLLSIA